MNAVEKFFVTGASGFVGRQLCTLLRGAGHEVNALVRTGDPDLEKLGVRTWPGDLACRGTWVEGLRGAGYVIHCAGDARFGNGGHYRRINVGLTQELLATVRQAAPNLRRFVFVSTIGVVDRPAGDDCSQPLTETSPAHPTSDYGRSKLEAEELVRQSGLPYSIVRPAMVIGRDMRLNSHMAVFIGWAAKGSWRARFAWPGKFSVVSVDDLAVALLLCARHPQALGETYFCAGETIALTDCLEAGRPGAVRFPLAWLRILPASLLPFGVKALLLPALTASDAKLRRLGWAPQRTANSVLAEIAVREKARLDPAADPGGQTVITGAASGLGLALTLWLVERRGNLLLIDRDQAGLEGLARAHPNCRILVADLGKEEELQRIMATPAWSEHSITELYAIAGIGKRGAVLGLPLKEQLDTFKVNVFARLILAQSAVQSMCRRHFGRVLLISSSSAFQPLPYMAVYAASNVALLSLAEAWSAELNGTGIHLMVVCPGGMQTNFQLQGDVKVITTEKLMDPRYAATEIFKGLARRRTTLLLPFRSFAMSLAARVTPRKFLVLLWKHIMKRYR